MAGPAVGLTQVGHAPIRFATNDPRKGRPRCPFIAAKRSISSFEISNFDGPTNQAINSGEECSQNWGGVRLVISDDQIDGRRLAFEGTAGHGPR